MVAGCGFQPLYKQQEQREEIPETLESIKISRIDNRQGQLLRNALLDLLNPYGEPAHPRYRLEVNLTISEDAFGFRKDATAARMSMAAVATFSLKDLTSRKVLYKDSAEITTSVGIGDHSDQATFPAVTSLKKETERAMLLLAQEMKLQLSSFLATRPLVLSQP